MDHKITEESPLEHLSSLLYTRNIAGLCSGFSDHFSGFLAHFFNKDVHIPTDLWSNALKFRIMATFVIVATIYIQRKHTWRHYGEAFVLPEVPPSYCNKNGGIFWRHIPPRRQEAKNVKGMIDGLNGSSRKRCNDKIKSKK